MRNDQKFLSLYNELDAALRTHYRDNNHSNSVITRLISELTHSGNRAYEDYGRKLNMIRVLRNSLVHELDMNAEQLVDVSDETIKFLQNLIDMITHPLTAIDIATKFKDLCYIPIAEEEALLVDLVKRMRQKGFSQLPVLNSKFQLCGVFSANVLFDYVNRTQGDIQNATLKDVLPLIPIDKHFSETYMFVNADMNVRDLLDKLTVAFERNDKNAMVFVTQSGMEREPLLGIIVESDLAKAI